MKMVNNDYPETVGEFINKIQGSWTNGSVSFEISNLDVLDIKTSNEKDASIYSPSAKYHVAKNDDKWIITCGDIKGLGEYCVDSITNDEMWGHQVTKILVKTQMYCRPEPKDNNQNLE